MPETNLTPEDQKKVAATLNDLESLVPISEEDVQDRIKKVGQILESLGMEITDI